MEVAGCLQTVYDSQQDAHMVARTFTQQTTHRGQHTCACTSVCPSVPASFCSLHLGTFPRHVPGRSEALHSLQSPHAHSHAHRSHNLIIHTTLVHHYYTSTTTALSRGCRSSPRNIRGATNTKNTHRSTANHNEETAWHLEKRSCIGMTIQRMKWMAVPQAARKQRPMHCSPNLCKESLCTGAPKRGQESRFTQTCSGNGERERKFYRLDF